MKKKILIGLLSLIVILLVVLMFFAIYQKNHKMTKLEKMYVKNLIKENDNFVGIMSKKDDISRCVIYAIYDNYNKTGNTELTNEKIADKCNQVFSKKVKASDIKDTGLTSLLIENYIDKRNDNEIFSLVIPKENYRSVPLKVIKTYQLKDIKRNKDEYVVTYLEYEITDPYQILNYYTGLKNHDEDLINVINDYLSGDLFVGKFVTYLNNKDLDKYGKKTGKEINITYILKDEELLIK